MNNLCSKRIGDSLFKSKLFNSSLLYSLIIISLFCFLSFILFVSSFIDWKNTFTEFNLIFSLDRKVLILKLYSTKSRIFFSWLSSPFFNSYSKSKILSPLFFSVFNLIIIGLFCPLSSSVFVSFIYTGVNCSSFINWKNIFSSFSFNFLKFPKRDK